MKFVKFFSAIVLLLFLFSCNNEKNNIEKKDDTTNVMTHNSQNNYVFPDFKYTFDISPDKKITCGDIINVNFSIDDTLKIDSIKLFFNDLEIISSTDNKISAEINTSSSPVGERSVKITLYKNNSHKNLSKNIIILSDIVPKKMSYKIINTFPHDENAYTQGLVYDNGVLYEATGLKTKSSLRKVKLETGEILLSVNNPNDVFGEGITIFNDKIIQITWRNRIGYVYDKETFQVINEFSYNTEGWGLTTDGKKLFMSDGSNIIYILDPQTYFVTGKIQVFNNERKIMYLNELEYINGLIYANVYTEDYIVAIDPQTGKVVQHIDLSGILPDAIKTENTDVLNGIAYDKVNNRIFVTGKNWKLLFQVEFK